MIAGVMMMMCVCVLLLLGEMKHSLQNGRKRKKCSPFSSPSLSLSLQHSHHSLSPTRLIPRSITHSSHSSRILQPIQSWATPASASFFSFLSMIHVLESECDRQGSGQQMLTWIPDSITRNICVIHTGHCRFEYIDLLSRRGDSLTTWKSIHHRFMGWVPWSTRVQSFQKHRAYHSWQRDTESESRSAKTK